MFKYSICSYSTNHLLPYTVLFHSLNTASVLIQLSLSHFNEVIINQFKYSICSYSTVTRIRKSGLLLSLNTASVLIQPKAGLQTITGILV